MLPTLPIGPLRIQTYGLFLLIAFWLGMTLAAREGARRGMERDHVYNAGFYALVAGLIAARLGHVVAFFEIYATGPLQVLSLSPGALVPLAGLVGALTTAVLYAQRCRLPIPTLTDALAPGFLVGAAIASVGAFLAGRALGSLSQLPWAIELFGVRRHPTALYEALALLVGLGLLLRLTRSPRPAGWATLVAIFIYATVRLFLEPLRADSVTIGEGWRLVQLVALGAVAVSGWLLGRVTVNRVDLPDPSNRTSQPEGS